MLTLTVTGIIFVNTMYPCWGSLCVEWQPLRQAFSGLLSFPGYGGLLKPEENSAEHWESKHRLRHPHRTTPN